MAFSTLSSWFLVIDRITQRETCHFWLRHRQRVIPIHMFISIPLHLPLFSQTRCCRFISLMFLDLYRSLPQLLLWQHICLLIWDLSKIVLFTYYWSIPINTLWWWSINCETSILERKKGIYTLSRGLQTVFGKHCCMICLNIKFFSRLSCTLL